jgi:regulatory protein
MDRQWLEQRALRYAARWEASAATLRSLLERKIFERCDRTGESPDAALEQIPATVAGLVERGYIDDHRFASQALDRLRRQGRSTAQIRARLHAKGISKSLLDELIEQEDADTESRAAWRFARRRRLGPYCEDPAQRRRARDRHLAALGRQGFDQQLALRIVDAQTPPEGL